MRRYISSATEEVSVMFLRRDQALFDSIVGPMAHTFTDK